MKYNERVFASETVDLDRNEYHDCTFDKCTIRYGGGQFTMIDSTFDGCEFVFSDAAANTLQLMGFMYTSGAKDFIENSLAQYRNT